MKKTPLVFLVILIISFVLSFTLNFGGIFLSSSIKNNIPIGNRIIMKLNDTFSYGSKTDIWSPNSKKWRNESIKYSNFWEKNISKIKKIFEEEKLKPDTSFSNKAAIHFRCSDVPFNKHPEYPLHPKEYFHFVAEKIKESGVGEVVFINCSSWRSNATGIENVDEICNNYIETIADWLGEKLDIKINREKICVDVKETYSIMLGSKLLISTGGSFSFIPGMVKGKNFISPSFLGENVNLKMLENWKNISKEVHWAMWDKFDIVSHQNIDYKSFDYKNYFDHKRQI